MFAPQQTFDIGHCTTNHGASVRLSLAVTLTVFTTFIPVLVLAHLAFVAYFTADSAYAPIALALVAILFLGNGIEYIRACSARYHERMQCGCPVY